MPSVPAKSSSHASTVRQSCVNQSYLQRTCAPVLADLRLTFNDLESFATVENRYQDLGVRIENAIAIQPSNPIFCPNSTTSGLVPRGSLPQITVSFQGAMQRISIKVIGVREIRLAAYDAGDHLLGHVIHEATFPEISAPDCLPWRSLEILAKDVRRILITSSSPFVLGSLSTQVTTEP